LPQMLNRQKKARDSVFPDLFCILFTFSRKF
jgi:hypothetical protein